jgi:hypothetical protein
MKEKKFNEKLQEEGEEEEETRWRKTSSTTEMKNPNHFENVS